MLLLNIPRDKYTKAGPYIETTDEEYKKYMDYVKSSKFIKTLKEQDIQVDVKAQLACKTLEEEEEGGGSDVTATWLYNFQGLEAGVVIFLPGDPARNPDAPAQEPREIPAPGLKTVATAQALEQTGNQTPSAKKPPSQAAGIAGEHKPASTRSVSATETRKKQKRWSFGIVHRPQMLQDEQEQEEEHAHTVCLSCCGRRRTLPDTATGTRPTSWLQGPEVCPCSSLLCHDVCMHIAVIVDTCSRLDPKLCPCLLLWCHY